MYQFSFKGGVSQITTHESEKFLLFVVVNGREVPFYNLLNQGIIKRGEEHLSYYSPYPHLKLFLYHSGFGREKRMFSFYVQLLNPPAKIVTVSPFVSVGVYHLRGRMRFLTTAETLEILDPSDNSYQYLKNFRAHLPKQTILSLIQVDSSELRQGVRKVRLR